MLSSAATAALSDLLPEPILGKVFDTLWGTEVDFKSKFNKSLDSLPPNWYWHLRETNVMKLQGHVHTALSDNMYCPHCGEKTLFPFTLEKCWDCSHFKSRFLRRSPIHHPHR